MTYRAVVFDLFGTLIDNFTATEYERVLWEIADVVGAPPADFARAWLAAYVERLDGTFATPEANVAGVCERIGVRPDPEQVAAAARIRVAYTRRGMSPRPGAVETLAELKARGYRTGLITDCSAEVPYLWPESPLARYVDVPVFSSAVGMKKPDPRIYRLACRKLEVKPEDCMYVGDGGSRELSGAARVGMHPVMIRAPYESATDVTRLEGEEWPGPTITAPSDVLALLG